MLKNVEADTPKRKNGANVGELPLWDFVWAAVKRQARLTFDDRHERVTKPDGSASTRRVMELKLIETS
jgi:hypothetical protein